MLLFCMFLIYLSLLLFISHEKSETQSYGILISLEYWELESIQKLLQVCVLNQAPHAFT